MVPGKNNSSDALGGLIRPQVSPKLRAILEDTRREIAEDREKHSLRWMRDRLKHAPSVLSFHDALADGNAVIAEIKQRSPSQGSMLKRNVDEALAAYKASQIVKAVSVLTSRANFGKDMDMKRFAKAREFINKPVLRKDFIVDPYQVYQARAFGADAILLMANVLTPHGLRVLSMLANDLGMDVLFETHTPAELAELPETARVVGINCRNFGGKSGDFKLARLLRHWMPFVENDATTNISKFDYAHELPSNVVKVAESGVTPRNCEAVFARGFHAILVGTSLLMDKRGVHSALAGFENALRGAPMRHAELVMQPS